MLGVIAFPCLPPSRSLKPTMPEVIGIHHQREACLTEETELAMEAQKNLSFQAKRRTRNPTEWQTMAEAWEAGPRPAPDMRQAEHPASSLLTLSGFP